METEILTAISNYGFPIVAYLLMYLDLRRIINSNTETLKELILHLKGGYEHGSE